MTILEDVLNKDKLPNSIGDLKAKIPPEGWYIGEYVYFGDTVHSKPSKSAGGRSETETSKKVQDFISAIERGDLAAIKKMDQTELKKWINEAVIQMHPSRIHGPNGVKWYREPTAEEKKKVMKDLGQVPGYTPLMLAALEGKTDIMRYLIDELGADLGLVNCENGKNAADYLRHYKDQQKARQVKQKQRDELEDLMDEVDGKKKPLPPRGLKIDVLKGPLDKKKSGRQFGNGKGLDDRIAKETASHEKLHTAISKKKLMPRAK